MLTTFQARVLQASCAYKAPIHVFAAARACTAKHAWQQHHGRLVDFSPSRTFEMVSRNCCTIIF